MTGLARSLTVSLHWSRQKPQFVTPITARIGSACLDLRGRRLIGHMRGHGARPAKEPAMPVKRTIQCCGLRNGFLRKTERCPTFEDMSSETGGYVADRSRILSRSLGRGSTSSMLWPDCGVAPRTRPGNSPAHRHCGRLWEARPGIVSGPPWKLDIIRGAASVARYPRGGSDRRVDRDPTHCRRAPARVDSQ